MRAHYPRLLALFVVLTGALFLVACGKKAPADGTSGTPKILNFGNGSEPQDLDPHIVTGVTENHIVTAIFEGLVNHHPSGVGTSPGVAERWETSPDALTWTFHLRADAKWSNGDPVTSTDFLRSFKRILTPSLAAEYAYKLHHVIGAEEYNAGTLTDFSQTGFLAPDERTLILRLKHRVPYLLEGLKHYSWFPVHLPSMEKFGPTDRRGSLWTRPGNLVGNGPFTLLTWQPNQIIRVGKSATYWDAANVKLDGIAFFPVDDAKTEERMFRSGQLHITGTVPLERIATYKKDHPEQLRIDPYYGTYFYRVNVTRPPLNDVRIRRALALAIDRQAIADTVLRAGQEPALSFTPPYAGFVPTVTLDGDLAEARRLLAEAGFPEGRGLKPIELLYNTFEAHKSIAEAVQQMWKTKLGVDVVLRNEEWKVYLDSQDNLNFDLSRSGWIGDFPDPHTFLDMWKTGGGNNDTGYANPAYDQLLATALEAPDEAGRFAIYQQLDAMLTRDVPVIPLYYYKSTFLISPKVQGWVPNIIDNRHWARISLSD